VTRKARWVFATSNAGKVAELAALLDASGLAIELVAQSALGVKPAKETAATFVENALRKARHAARATGLPAIADDSGLAVDALAGAPSVRSARFAGPRATDERNNALLLERLADVPDGKRQGRFHCVLVALRGPEDPAPLIAAGEWSGEIARAPMGRGGFGYDPVFFDPMLGKTAAMLDVAEKNRVSHRARALRALSTLLTKRGDLGSG
jgi:XTP/dITP diphosphohydrolase